MGSGAGPQGRGAQAQPECPSHDPAFFNRPSLCSPEPVHRVLAADAGWHRQSRGRMNGLAGAWSPVGVPRAQGWGLCMAPSDPGRFPDARDRSSRVCYILGLTQGSVPMSPEQLLNPTQTHHHCLDAADLGAHHTQRGVLNPLKSPQVPQDEAWYSMPFELQPN